MPDDRYKIGMAGETFIIYFTSDPVTLESIQEARKQLDKLTDKIIGRLLNVNSTINPSQE